MMPCIMRQISSFFPPLKTILTQAHWSIECSPGMPMSGEHQVVLRGVKAESNKWVGIRLDCDPTSAFRSAVP